MASNHFREVRLLGLSLPAEQALDVLVISLQRIEPRLLVKVEKQGKMKSELIL